MNILLVEDDADTAAYIAGRLSECGYRVDTGANGRDALRLAYDNAYRAAIVDRMLPGLDGLGLVKALRGAGIGTPVLFLTALSGIDDRVEGLAAGGDDYLIKPFAIAELLARVHALTRRAASAPPATVLRVADLELDLIERRVIRNGRQIALQPREFALLEYLMRNAGRAVTRTMLLERVWDFHFDPKTNIVATHISRLRAKVDRGRGATLIRTVRGAGYMLSAPA